MGFFYLFHSGVTAYLYNAWSGALWAQPEVACSAVQCIMGTGFL